MCNKKIFPQGQEIVRGTWRDDWRIMGQEGYLIGKHLEHRFFDRALCYLDFDQCDFCWRCFDNDKTSPVEAYYVPDERKWICEDCYRDFQRYFHWEVTEIERGAGDGANQV